MTKRFVGRHADGTITQDDFMPARDEWIWRDEIVSADAFKDLGSFEQPQIHSHQRKDHLRIPLLDPISDPNPARTRILKVTISATEVESAHVGDIHELDGLRNDLLDGGMLRETAEETVTSALVVCHILRTQLHRIDEALGRLDDDVAALEKNVLAEGVAGRETRTSILRQLIAVARIGKLYGAYGRVRDVLRDPRIGAYREEDTESPAGEEREVHLDEIRDQVQRGAARSVQLREVLMALESRLLLDETERTNRRLAILSYVLLPASLVTGIFGMNFMDNFPSWDFRVVLVAILAFLFISALVASRGAASAWIEKRRRKN